MEKIGLNPSRGGDTIDIAMDCGNTGKEKRMIRGLQKQMIQLVTPNNKYFEVVFFVLRPTFSREKGNDAEIVRAAQKILLESAPKKKRAPLLSGKQKWGFFFGGVLCGGLLCAATVAILAAVL